MAYEDWADQELKDELKQLDEEEKLEGKWEIDFVEDCAYSPGKLTPKMRAKAIQVIEERS